MSILNISDKSKRKQETNQNNSITRTLMIILMAFTVMFSNSVIRNISPQIMLNSMVTLLDASNAFAEQQKESSDSAMKDMTDHSGMDMDQPSKDGMTYEVSSAFKKQLDQVFPAYYHIQFALSHDNVANAKEGASHLQMTLPQVDMSLVAGEAHMAWMKELGIIKKNSKIIAESDDIKASRAAFIPLSQSMITVAKMFGTSSGAGTYLFHCPMADNNKGADWLQNKPDLENPFFGSMMFKCGELVETINK